MAKGSKKGCCGCLTVFAILLVFVLVVGFIIVLLDDDNESETDYDTTAIGTAQGGYGQDNRDELAAHFGQDTIRDYYVKLKGNNADKVTILVYMNGSDLESESQEATSDLSEMIAGAGVSDQVNIIVQTMGTKKWDAKFGISNKKTERYKLDGNGLTLVDGSLSQLDCTNPKTLSDFIKWGAANYPANRYILVFWNHGGGSVYGFGSDEWVSDEEATLTIDEIHSALNTAGVTFDFIGMDCCIMSSLEICYALEPYCDYTILSEDFESGLGWYYTNWIKALYANTSISTQELGKLICDDMVAANTRNQEEGGNSILALVDETMVDLLFSSWKEFAYNAENELTDKNYSRPMKPKRGGRVHPLLSRDLGGEKRNKGFLYNLFFGEDEAEIGDYYEVDIMSAASTINSTVSNVLKSAIANTLVYVAYTEGDSHLTGLAVSLPYGDQSGYNSMKTIFGNIGMDRQYINWLEQFVELENTDSYDYNFFDEEWNGWGDYDDDDYDYDDFSIWDLIFAD